MSSEQILFSIVIVLAGIIQGVIVNKLNSLTKTDEKVTSCLTAIKVDIGIVKTEIENLKGKKQ